MAFGIFRRIGRGVWLGVRKVDLSIERLDRLPRGKSIVLITPIYGPLAKMAQEAIGDAEGKFAGSRSGKKKMASALELFRARLKEIQDDDELTGEEAKALRAEGAFVRRAGTHSDEQERGRDLKTGAPFGDHGEPPDERLYDEVFLETMITEGEAEFFLENMLLVRKGITSIGEVREG